MKRPTTTYLRVVRTFSGQNKYEKSTMHVLVFNNPKKKKEHVLDNVYVERESTGKEV